MCNRTGQSKPVSNQNKDATSYPNAEELHAIVQEVTSDGRKGTYSRTLSKRKLA
jgi:hypothetical protein